MKFIIQSFDDLERAAQEIILNSKYKIITLTGNLGSGKTSLVKLFCKILGSEDMVTSPTFPIINEYVLPSGKVYHFDLYRIKSKEELFNIGFDEYIDSGEYCFIEWPEICKSELPEHHEISLSLENQIRNLTFK